MAPGTRIRRIGLCGNPRKEEFKAAFDRFASICHNCGIDVSVHSEMARVASDMAPMRNELELVAWSQLIVAMGGDGTMLKAARMIGDAGIPLLGINLGSLGYLADIPLAGLATAIDRVLCGDYIVVGRSRVHCTLWRNGAVHDEIAGLNDVVVNMGPLPKTLDLELQFAGTSLGRFLGDGVIFATATGSTAYSLSAGGTICQPDLPGLLVTPICPHSLGLRPLILNDSVDIQLVLHEVGEGATLTTDGQLAQPLFNMDRLSCRLTPPNVRLVKFPDSNFFEVLRQKLRWGMPTRLRAGSRRYHPGCEPDDWTL